MPIYMDVHIVPGVNAKDVAEAHNQDILLQNDYSCRCMTYWIDEERGNVFCLIDAPDKKSVEELHGKAHGLIPSKIIEVNSELVKSFLGRIYDPTDAEIHNGLKVFTDPSFRVIMLTKVIDPVLLCHQMGKEKCHELLDRHTDLVREKIAFYDGCEAEQRDYGFVVTFQSAAKAVACSLAIQKHMNQYDAAVPGFRIGVHAGEPVSESDDFFGDTLQLAGLMCGIARDNQILISNSVKELINKEHFDSGQCLISLSIQDEIFLRNLFNTLEENWQQPEFQVSDYSKALAMSDSQLYRKIVSLCGCSPLDMLKNYRLHMALDLMKKKRHNISETTFNSGFSSPSYFTKCFKKKFGILPGTYLSML